MTLPIMKVLDSGAPEVSPCPSKSQCFLRAEARALLLEANLLADQLLSAEMGP